MSNAWRSRDVRARIVGALRGEALLLVLLAVLGVLLAATPTEAARLPGYVDGTTLAALAGLLALTKAVELSGALGVLGARLVRAAGTERRLALLLAGAAALLSMIVTNDVALFAVVPLTLTLRGHGSLPITRLVIIEALAVNAGSTLTPTGNPQNLFLWQESQESFAGFVAALAPTAAVFCACLLVLVVLAFAPRPLTAAPEQVRAVAAGPSLDRRLLWLGALPYLPFIALCQVRHADYAAGAVLALFALADRRVLRHMDWPLLAVILLMFVDLRALAALPFVRHLLSHAQLGDATHLYWVAVGTSQVVSNVPAAILLSEYSTDWRVIASGVNVGGFGLALGSLANLIALRQLGERRAWLTFHAYAVPFLVVCATIVYSSRLWNL